jgi:hypothetical protein
MGVTCRFRLQLCWRLGSGRGYPATTQRLCSGYHAFGCLLPITNRHREPSLERPLKILSSLVERAMSRCQAACSCLQLRGGQHGYMTPLASVRRPWHGLSVMAPQQHRQAHARAAYALPYHAQLNALGWQAVPLRILPCHAPADCLPNMTARGLVERPHQVLPISFAWQWCGDSMLSGVLTHNAHAQLFAVPRATLETQLRAAGRQRLQSSRGVQALASLLYQGGHQFRRHGVLRGKGIRS